jgi:hypothetical protein
VAGGRQPDYRLAALNKRTDEKGNNIGAAWINDNGSISIRLDSFVVLTGSKDLVLTLFKADDRPRGQRLQESIPEHDPDDGPPF